MLHGNIGKPMCKFGIKWMCFSQYWMYFGQWVDVKMPVFDVFMAIILCMTVWLAEVYTLWQIYIQMYFYRMWKCHVSMFFIPSKATWKLEIYICPLRVGKCFVFSRLLFKMAFLHSLTHLVRSRRCVWNNLDDIKFMYRNMIFSAVVIDTLM